MATAVIHGKEIEYDSTVEYGLFFADQMGFQNYFALYVPQSADRLNMLNKDKVIEEAKLLKTTAETQIKWKSTPSIMGSPILTVNKTPVSINEVRKNIENTKLFAENIVSVLSGE